MTKPPFRIQRVIPRSWYAPMIGLLIGMAYGLVTYLIDLEDVRTPRIFVWLDDIMTFGFPVTLGIGAGLAVNYIRRQVRLNRQLSTDNAKLQYHVLTSTLGSHILHEIRNPLHNLMAIVENWRQRVPQDELVILQRNMVRLQVVTDRLSRWNALDEALDLRQPVALIPWFEEFLTDKVSVELHELGGQLEQRVEPVIVSMHPLLLEQCCVSLFNNALEALRRSEARCLLRLSVDISPTRPGYVEVRIGNTGSQYPSSVLRAQGTMPVGSHQGLGLVLVRRALEQINGSLTLANEEDAAVAILHIPGFRA